MDEYSRRIQNEFMIAKRINLWMYRIISQLSHNYITKRSPAVDVFKFYRDGAHEVEAEIEA